MELGRRRQARADVRLLVLFDAHLITLVIEHRLAVICWREDILEQEWITFIELNAPTKSLRPLLFGLMVNLLYFFGFIYYLCSFTMKYDGPHILRDVPWLTNCLVVFNLVNRLPIVI